MEDIEYLEEYEDLILPTIKSNSGQVNNNSTNMMQDEDSSSIDPDIFESLFDDNSEDEGTILQKKVDPKLSQRRLDDRASLDSLDMLVKDLVGEQNKTQANTTPGPKGYTQLSKKLTSTPNAQQADGRGFQKATTSKASPHLKGRPVPQTKTSNSGQSSKAPIGGRIPIHHQFPKRTPTAEGKIMTNRPKSKPIPTKNTNRPDTTKYDKRKTVATVRPTVQQQQPNRVPPGNANRSIGYSSSQRPSSSAVNTATRKQFSTSLQKNKNVTLPPSRRPVQRPPTTIVKPEKREIKDPSEDPLSLDDIAEALLDSDSDSFSLSDISDDALESLSDFEEDPNNVIDISNDSSIDGKINHKDLENARAETPSPTVSDDREEIILSPSPNQMTTKVNKFEIIRRQEDVKKETVARVLGDDITPSTSIKKLPEKVTILSDTLLSRIDTALLATAVVDDPPNKTIKKTNAPVLSPTEISTAADICTNVIVSLSESTKESAVLNANIFDEFHGAADLVEEHIIENEEIVEEEIKEHIKEDLQTTSIITDEILVANEDKHELNLFLDGHVDVDQQKENIEVAMEVEIETNEDTENTNEAIEGTIFDGTVVEENIEECEDMTEEVIEEYNEEASEAMEKDKISENTKTQVEANKIENLKEVIPKDLDSKIENLEEVKSNHLKRKRKADSVTSTSSLESSDANKKDFKEPLNLQDNILTKEEVKGVESSTLSKRLPSNEKSEDTPPTVPAKKAKIEGRTRRRFRNLDGSDKATDTSESEIEILPSSQHRRRPKVTEMSQAVDSNNDSKIAQKISRDHQKESGTETETETGEQHNASVSGIKDKSKPRNSFNNSESNKSAEESKQMETTVEKTKQNIDHQKEDIISKPVTPKEMHCNTPTLRKSSRSRSSQASDSNDTEDEKSVNNFKGPPQKVDSIKDKTKLKSKTKAAIIKGKDITEDNKSLSSENEERNNKISKELLQDDNNDEEKVTSIDTTENVKANTEATGTYTNEEETKTPTKMCVRLKRIEEKPFNKILVEETQEPTVSSTMSEDNLSTINKIKVNPEEKSTESISSKEIEKEDETLQINEITKLNEEHDANTALETKSTDKSDLKSTEKESNKNETVINEVLHSTRKSLKFKDTEHTCQSENISNNERSNTAGQKSAQASCALITDDTMENGSQIDNKESKELNEKIEHTTRSASKTKEAGKTISNDSNKSSEESNITAQKEEHSPRSSARPKVTKSRLYTDQKGQHATRSTLKIKAGNNDDHKVIEESNLSDRQKNQTKGSPITGNADKKSEETKASNKEIELKIGSVVSTIESDKVCYYDKKSLQEIIIGCQKSEPPTRSTAQELHPVGGNEDNKTSKKCNVIDKKVENEKIISKEIDATNKTIEEPKKEDNVDEEKIKEDKIVRDATNQEIKHITRSANKTKGSDRSKETDNKNLEERTDKLSHKEIRIQTSSTAKSTSTTKLDTKTKASEVKNVVTKGQEKTVTSENSKTISLSPLPTRKSIRSNIMEKDVKLTDTVEEKRNISLTNKTPDKSQQKRKADEEDCTNIGHTHSTRRTVKLKAEDKQNSIENRTISSSSLSTRNATKIIEGHVDMKSLASEGIKLREKIVDTKPVKVAVEEKPSEKNTNKTEEKAGKSIIKSPPRTNFIVRRNYKNQAISQRPEEYANAILTKSGMSLKEWQEAQKAKSGEKTSSPEKKRVDSRKPNSGQDNKPVVSPSESPAKQIIAADKKTEKVNAKETTEASSQILADTSKEKLSNVNVTKEPSTKKSDKPIAETINVSKSLSEDAPNKTNEKSDKSIDKMHNTCKSFSINISKQTTNEKLDESIANKHNISKSKSADLPNESLSENSDKCIKITQSILPSTTSSKTHSSKDSTKETLSDKGISNNKRETLNDKKDTLKDKKATSGDDNGNLSDKKKTSSEKRDTSSDKKETLSIQKKTLSDKGETVNNEKGTLSESKDIIIDMKKSTKIKPIEGLAEKEKTNTKVEIETTNKFNNKHANEETPKNFEIEKISEVDEVKGNLSNETTVTNNTTSVENAMTSAKADGKNSQTLTASLKDAGSVILNESQNNVNSTPVYVVEESSHNKPANTSVSKCTHKAKDQHDTGSISQNIESTGYVKKSETCPELEVLNEPKQQIQKDKITTRETKEGKSIVETGKTVNESTTKIEHTKATKTKVIEKQNLDSVEEISNILDTNEKSNIEINDKTTEKRIATPRIELNPKDSQITSDKIPIETNETVTSENVNKGNDSNNANDKITSPSPKRKAGKRLKTEIEILMESLPKGLEFPNEDSKRRRRELPSGRKHSNLDDTNASFIFKTPPGPVKTLSMIATPMKNPFAGDIGLPHITRSIVKANKSIKLASWKSKIIQGHTRRRNPDKSRLNKGNSRKRPSSAPAKKSTKSIPEKSKKNSDEISKLVLPDSLIIADKNSKAVLQVSTTSTSEKIEEISKKDSEDIPKTAEILEKKPIGDESSRNKTDVIAASSNNCVLTGNKSVSNVPVRSFICHKLRVRLNRSFVKNYWMNLKTSKTKAMHPTTASKSSTESVRSSNKSRTPNEHANSLASMLLKALNAPCIPPPPPHLTRKSFATPTVADSSKALSTQQQFYSTVITRAKAMPQKSHPPVSSVSTTQEHQMQPVNLNLTDNTSHEMTTSTTNTDLHCDETFLLTPLKTAGAAPSGVRQQTQQQQQQKRSARLQQLTQKQIAQEATPTTPTQSTKAQLAPKSNLQQQQTNFSPIVPKKEIEDEQTTATVAAQSVSALMAGGLPAVVVDNSGTRLYSFLHPAKYNRSHGAVLLDYCCPNLNGPMPAIDPTRDHSQVQTLVRELPAYIAMTTTVITRADLEDRNNSIPASIRKKYAATCPARVPTIPTATVTAAVTTGSQPPPHIASTLPHAPPHTALTAPLTAFTPSISALQKQLPPTTTLTPKILPLSLPVPTSSTDCLPTLTPFSAMTSSNVVTAETAANAPPLTPFSAMTSSNVATMETGAGTAAKQLQKPDYQRFNNLRTNMRRFDNLIKKYSPRISSLSYSERQRIMESIVNHTKLSPKDIENATYLLEDYCQQIVNLVPQKPVSYVATPTINTATHTTAPTTSNIGSNFSSSATAIVQSSPLSSSSATAAARKLEQMHASAVQKVKTSGSSAVLQRQVPIYDKDRNIIGYQMQVAPATMSSIISQRAGMSPKQTTASVPNSAVKRLTMGATAPASTLKQPAQESPRIFYTKPIQTSTPISASTTSSPTAIEEAAARLGRSVTIRHIAAKNLPTPCLPQTPPSINASGGIMSKHLPKVTLGNIKTTHSLTSTSFTPLVAAVTTTTTSQRVTRHAATNKSEQIVIITKDKDGSLLTTNNPDECIFPDEGRSEAEQTEIKLEREDDLLTGSS